MKNKNDILEELEREAPFLSKIEKKSAFSTPNNYFEVLPEVISSKILNKNILHISFNKLSYRILLPISAIVVLLFVVFNWSNNPIEFELTNEQLSELMIEEDYIGIDDYLVYESYAEILEEENEESSETQEYIDYLIDNNIDINSIIEEL